MRAGKIRALAAGALAALAMGQNVQLVSPTAESAQAVVTEMRGQSAASSDQATAPQLAPAVQSATLFRRSGSRSGGRATTSGIPWPGRTAARARYNGGGRRPR